MRAKNTQGETIDWSSVQRHSFRRHWPDRPISQHPLNPHGKTAPDAGQYPLPGPAFGDDFYFQWTPVQHATRYQLAVGTDPNFSPDTFDTCETAGTTYAAGYRINPQDQCMPSQGSVYYWKVRAIDDPSGAQGIYSEIHAFVYDSGVVSRRPRSARQSRFRPSSGRHLRTPSAIASPSPTRQERRLPRRTPTR